METKEKSTSRKKRETVFSKTAIHDLEWLINWFWNEFEGIEMSKILMKMLEMYIENPHTESYYEIFPHCKPEKMVSIVSSIIQLKERLTEIMNYEKAWDWEYNDTKDCWDKPEYIEQNLYKYEKQ